MRKTKDELRSMQVVCVEDIDTFRREAFANISELNLELSALKAESDWISVEDRLPLKTEDVKSYDTVLVITLSKNNNVTACNFELGNTANTWHRFNIGLNDAVTHWMPLPPPPQ